MISYVLTYRQGSLDRKKNLTTVLQWLQHIDISGMEVVIVEQDNWPKFVVEPSYSFPLRYIFVRNPKLFNRAWGFNVAIKNTLSQILFFADADMIVAPEHLKISIDLLKSFKYEAVSPFTECLDLNRVETRSIDVGNFKYDKGGIARNCISLCSGIVGYSRTSMERINGWDERFEGWGGEDDIQSIKTKQTLSSIALDNKCFHLHHARSKNDGSDQHHNYKHNLKLFLQYKKNPSQILLDMNAFGEIGRVNRYDEEFEERHNNITPFFFGSQNKVY